MGGGGAGQEAPGELHLSPHLLALLLDRLNVGVLTLSLDMTVLQWNRFLHAHTGVPASEVVGQNLFARFPELDREWIERKVRGVALLKTFAFSSWQQRPYVFRVENHRPITKTLEPMRQDGAFIPLVEDGVAKAVSIILIDATDTFESRTRLDAALAALAAQSERDGLTGIFNRRKLDEMMDAEIKRARRYHHELSIVMFDIDHFKRVNDRFGHLLGDEAIKHVARMATNTLRETDVVARYGGEEFVVLLPEVGLEGGEIAAERVRQMIARRPVPAEPEPIPVTVSLGVTALRDGQQDGHALIAEADAALYRSKSGGRNRTSVFHPASPGPDA